MQKYDVVYQSLFVTFIGYQYNIDHMSQDSRMKQEYTLSNMEVFL